MSYALKNRSLLSLEELTADELHFLLEMAHALKRSRLAGTEQAQLRDKNIALLAERAGTRAHTELELAAREQGANVTVIGPGGTRLVTIDQVKEPARVLGRLYDAIEVRDAKREVVDALATHAGVPVWHGLTQPYHPTQVLADYMTMQEHCPNRPLSQLRLAYVGDARRRISDALLQGAAIIGMDFRIAAPPALWPPRERIEAAQAKASHSGAALRLTASAAEAVQGVDFVFTDIWVARPEPDMLWAGHIARMLPYRVNAAMLASSVNPAVKFLHGLPSPGDRAIRQDDQINRAYGLDALEVTSDVLASPASIVADQAENRLHAVKALLVATLA
jgi:ornithine carbamoyltransferase